MMQPLLFAPAAEPPRTIKIPTLRPYQESAIEQIKRLIREGAKRILVVAPTGCHARGQLVLMHDGSTKRVEDVVVGDRLMGPDSAPRDVLQLRRGRQEMARIVPTKGDAWTVNLDHVLTLVRTNDGWGKSGSVIDVTVRDWLSWSRTQKGLHKLFRVPVTFATREQTLLVEPYFLGLLLSDGAIKHGVGVSKPDAEIRTACEAQATACGMHVWADAPQSSSVTWHLRGRSGPGGNPIRTALRSLGLYGTESGTKFIPDVYKTASQAERLSLLAGILDGDGHHTHGGYDYISKSAQLARDVAFVCRSLGLAAYVTPCIKTCQTGASGAYFRVSISGDCSAIPCKIPRKIAAPRRQKKSVLRTGFSVELLPEDEFFGFTLDGDGRYLLGDFTVTHNSGKTVLFARLVAGACAKISPSLILAHRGELLEQTWRKVEDAGVPREQLGMIWASDRRANARALCQIASVQTLVRRRPPPAKLVVIDESHRALSESYLQLVAEYPDAVVVGFTATPWRLDGKGLGQLYEKLVVVATVPELIEQGFLCKPRVFSHPTKPDLSGVKLKGGDYDERALAKAVDTKVLIGSIVEHWQLHAQGARTIAFAASVEHSKNIAQAFIDAGIPAEHVDGETPADDRAAILARLASGETRVISNCSLFTEGFDCLDTATEILTPDGWRGHGQVREGDTVYSLNRETGFLEAVSALRVVERTMREGERMVTIRSQHLNIRTTEGHEFHFRYRDPRNGGALSGTFLTKTAGEIVARRSAYALPLTAPPAEEFPGVPLTDDELRFVAWFMTDGGFVREREVCISQSKDVTRREIRALLGRLGFDFRFRIRERPGRYPNPRPLEEFTIPRGTHTGSLARNGWARLEPYLNKDVAPALQAMTSAQFEVFWAELLKGDGSNSSNKAKTAWLWCDRIEQVDAYTRMAIARGFSASYASQTTVHGRTVYRVSVRSTQWHTTNPGDPRAARATFEDPVPGEVVWCVSNRNSTLVTRRGGKIVVLGNCPAVKCVILARPTKSRALYFQCAGRGMRPDPEFPELRTCLVLDHAGCAHEHGLPQDPQDYSLEDGKRSRRAGEAPIRQCLACFAWSPSGALVCEECGTPFPAKEKASLKEEEGALKEIEDNEERRQKLEDARVSKLRKKCQAIALQFDEARRWSPGETNRLLFQRFGSRTKMTAARLEEVIAYVQEDFARLYPLPPREPETTPDPQAGLRATLSKLLDGPAPDADEIVEVSL